jgi:hypothetical protein
MKRVYDLDRMKENIDETPSAHEMRTGYQAGLPGTLVRFLWASIAMVLIHNIQGMLFHSTAGGSSGWRKSGLILK